MHGRRILIFIIVFLITLPIVTAAADGVDRSVDEGLIIRLGAVHEGERFVYDLHLTSTYRDVDIHIPAFHQVEIERLRDFQTLDGETHDVLATTVREKSLPWDEYGNPHEQSTVNMTQYLRVRDGVYLERLLERAETRWDEGNGAPSRSYWNDVRRIEGDGNGGDLYGRGLHPESAYTNGNLVQELLVSLVARTEGRVHEVGEWDGRTVYDIAGRTWEGPISRAQFRCSTTHPEAHYSDAASHEEMVGRTVTETSTLRTWIEPGVAFPVLDECHARYTDGGTVVEDLRLVLELTTHEQGGAAIPVDWDRRNARANYEPAGTLEPLPTTHAGVPHAGSALGVPLTRAVEAVLATDDGDLRAWMDPEPQPFWVVDGWYRPNVASSAPGEDEPSEPDPVPVPLPALPPQVPTDPVAPAEPAEADEHRTGITWGLRLANQAGQTRQVEIVFNETEPGVFPHADILMIEPSHEADPLVDGRLTATMVSLDALVDLFIADADVEPDQWLHDQQTYIWISNRIIDDGDGRFRASHSVSFSTRDPAAPAEATRSMQVVRDYDTRTGAPLQEGQSESWIVQDAPVPTAPTYSTSSSGPLAPIERFPAAATASGFALALAFAAAFFWDTVARTFGQFVGAPLHAKIHRDKVLDHKTRDRIVDQVSNNPGIAVEELRRELSVGYGTVCHHLDTLQRNGLLTSRKVGRRRCWFVPGAIDAQAMTAIGASGTSAAGRFLEIVTAEPGLSQREIALRLGVADSSVRYQAKRLLAHEQVRARRDGRTVRYYPRGDAAAAS